MLAFLLHDVPKYPSGAASRDTLVVVAERVAIDIIADSLQSGIPATCTAHIFGPTLVRSAGSAMHKMLSQSAVLTKVCPAKLAAGLPYEQKYLHMDRYGRSN